jgi:hypothetical protein
MSEYPKIIEGHTSDGDRIVEAEVEYRIDQSFEWVNSGKQKSASIIPCELMGAEDVAEYRTTEWSLIAEGRVYAKLEQQFEVSRDLMEAALECGRDPVTIGHKENTLLKAGLLHPESSEPGLKPIRYFYYLNAKYDRSELDLTEPVPE